MCRRLLVALALALGLALIAVPARAAVLDTHITVTFTDVGGCGESQYWTYVVVAKDSEGSVLGEIDLGYDEVTHNQDGTVTVSLAALKAQVGSADVTLHAYVIDECAFNESTVVILD